jgi:hypothetical protein
MCLMRRCMGVGLDLTRGGREETFVLNLSQAFVRACKVADAPNVADDTVGHVGRRSTEM